MSNRKQPTGRQHQFVPAPGAPPDHQGRIECQTCHVVGRTGDARHPDPAAPPRDLPRHLVEAAQAHDAAVLGERDREEYR
ncbi:hypothetical protein ABZ807_05605 [Micromonospora sp. NPDC047548]|uniref:hypothetical protein n=1 Tax=Micromonospora sp. NPDC047548 TaxID=3155624 RepID=UPI0033D444B6